MDDLLPEPDGDLNDPTNVVSFDAKRPPEGLFVAVERELTPEDLEDLVAAGPLGPRPQSAIAKLRYSHHQVARLLTQGASTAEICLITGYAPGTISGLKADPTFKELLATYSTERAVAFADVLERMKTAGISALEEIQERLNSEPEKWTKRELMEVAELMLVKGAPGGAKAGFGAPSGGGIAISVSFVAPPPSGATGPLLELEPNS